MGVLAGRALDSMLRAAVLAVALLVLTRPAFSEPDPHPSTADASACSPVLMAATRLVVVTAPDMNTVRATARLYTRPDPDAPWVERGAPWPAVVGRNGLGWAWDQPRPGGGPVKKEGDGKTPAGIFAAGVPFGFDRQPLEDYLVVQSGRTVCVDDVRSPLYNRITTADALAPGHSHEKMWKTSLYRQGLVVGHKTSAAKRGGSCIFLHVWRGPGSPTAGCVAFSEADMRAVQGAFDGRPSAIAILPAGAEPPCGLP